MKRWQQSAVFAVCSLGLGSSALANLTFDGTMIEPPACLINSGSNIEVDFKEVGIKKVDGVNYRERLSYAITCEAGTLPWEMVLRVEGVATTFESSALQTSVPDLGLQFFQNDIPLELNKGLVINPAAAPVLDVVPIKRAGTSLSQGDFSASATLLVKYQ